MPEDGCSHSIVRAIIKVTGFPGGAGGKESASKAGDTRDSGSIPGSGRSLTGGHGNSLQYSCLENLMERGTWKAWRATVYRIERVRHDQSDLAHTRILKALSN